MQDHRKFNLPPNNTKAGWLRGLGLLLLLHLFQIPLIMVTFGLGLWVICLSQFLYVVPAIIICKKKNRPDLVKGLVIGAALTFLLNGSCTAIATWTLVNDSKRPNVAVPAR